MTTKQLRTGDLHVAGGPAVLATSGIGSCIVICLWDSEAMVGAMAHVPFPNSLEKERDIFRKPGLSPDTAVPHMFAKMKRFGSRASDVSVRLIGAGNMFPATIGGPMTDLVADIYSSACTSVRNEGLAIVSESVGGSLGRSVVFDVASGVIIVRYTDGAEEEI